MAEWITLEQVFLGHPISVQFRSVGSDHAVVISGGCRPHIGSVSTAYWENGSVRCETSTGLGHYDDVVSKQFAQELAQICRCNVSVSCGIHYDHLSKADLPGVLDITDRLLKQLISHIAPLRSGQSN